MRGAAADSRLARTSPAARPRVTGALLRRMAAQQRGSTLVELLVAASCALTVTGAAMALLGVFAGEERRATGRTDQIAARQVAMDRITRDIRQASAATVSGGGATLQLATFVFEQRVKRAATVTYACSGGACRRIVSPALTGPPVISDLVDTPAVFSVTGPRHVTVTLRSARGTLTDGAQMVNAR